MQGNIDFRCLSLRKVQSGCGFPGQSLRPGGRWSHHRLAGALLCSALALLTGGCASEAVTYKLVPPTTAEGEACVAKCDDQRKECRDSLQNAFEVCQEQYRQDMATYTRCRNSSLGPAPGSQFACQLPRVCQLPSAEACDEPYRACFEACGGKVEQLPES